MPLPATTRPPHGPGRPGGAGGSAHSGGRPVGLVRHGRSRAAGGRASRWAEPDRGSALHRVVAIAAEDERCGDGAGRGLGGGHRRGAPSRRSAAGVSLLVVKQAGRAHVLANRCTHRGAPLSEGSAIGGLHHPACRTPAVPLGCRPRMHHLPLARQRVRPRYGNGSARSGGPTTTGI